VEQSSGSEGTEPSRQSSPEDNSLLNRWSMLFGIAASIAGIVTFILVYFPAVVHLVEHLVEPGPTARPQPGLGHTGSPTGHTSSPRPSPSPSPTPHPTAPSSPSASQPPARLTLQLQPNHGGTSATIYVYGTGCSQEDQIDIWVAGHALEGGTKCQDGTYQGQYAPYQNGKWTCVAGGKTLTLSPGKSYLVYAEDMGTGHESIFAPYRVE
jgi:hypothetical protein